MDFSPHLQPDEPPDPGISPTLFDPPPPPERVEPQPEPMTTPDNSVRGDFLGVSPQEASRKETPEAEGKNPCGCDGNCECCKKRKAKQAKKVKHADPLTNAVATMFDGYLADTDWRVRENANASRSVNGLNNYVREAFTQRYWLDTIYPEDIKQAHLSGDAHIHDLGFLGAYCAGWDVRQLLVEGFGGVAGKIESKPPKHLRSLLGQLVNFTFTAAGETAGAQAWSSLDTYAAPFIRYDGLDYTQVKQAVQEFVFNLNVPTRVGFQCPFSNLTFDLTCPKTLRDQAVIVGGQTTADTYGDFQPEMDLFNRAFCDVMTEGDAKGRVFTFPIPTINITPDLDWDNPSVTAFMETACKYGTPYFANYINSDLSPEDALSMCCRLRLDKRELRKRGGGLFGANPLTGSIGVFTINLPRLGFTSLTKAELFEKLDALVELGDRSLRIKRQVVEDLTDRGLYPYAAKTLGDVKKRTGGYWGNHFSTIGVIGMHEMLINFGIADGVASEEGQALAVEIMHRLRDRMSQLQDDTGQVYNLEASPAEGAAYRLARLDQEQHPGIHAAGLDHQTPGTRNGDPYYTNSTQLPVGFSDDVFDTLDLQDELQSLYTGGTVQHLYLGQRIDDPEAAKSLIRTVFKRYRLPYVSLTPTFSICPEHGYLPGEHHTCPKCGATCEVWSRVTGYLRPVSHYNQGKKREFADRKTFRLPQVAAG